MDLDGFLEKAMKKSGEKLKEFRDDNIAFSEEISYMSDDMLVRKYNDSRRGFGGSIKSSAHLVKIVEEIKNRGLQDRLQR